MATPPWDPNPPKDCDIQPKLIHGQMDPSVQLVNMYYELSNKMRALEELFCECSAGADTHLVELTYKNEELCALLNDGTEHCVIVRMPEQEPDSWQSPVVEAIIDEDIREE